VDLSFDLVGRNFQPPLGFLPASLFGAKSPGKSSDVPSPQCRIVNDSVS